MSARARSPPKRSAMWISTWRLSIWGLLGARHCGRAVSPGFFLREFGNGALRPGAEARQLRGVGEQPLRLEGHVPHRARSVPDRDLGKDLATALLPDDGRFHQRVE